MKKTCKTCGFAKNGNSCPVLKTTVDINKDSCPLHQTEVRTCPICGNAILQGTGTYSGELGILVCNDCTKYLYTCVTCKHNKQAPQCVADQYTGPKPVMIQVTKRQGFLTMTLPQLNPEVLDEVCPTCTCGSPYNCQRNLRCDNWESAI